MKRPSFSRTRPSPSSDDRGSVTAAVLLLAVLFTGLGLTMLHASVVHLKICAFRKFSTLLDCASENGLKRGLLDLAAWLRTEAFVAAVPEERVEALRQDPEAGFPLLVEAAWGSAFPRSLSETVGGMAWDSVSSVALGGLEDLGGWFRVTARLRIESSGGWVPVRPRRRSVLEGTLGMVAGRLPLPAIPFFLGTAMTEAEKAAFLEDSAIRLAPRPGELLAPGFAAAADGVIPADMTEAVGKALNIGLFRPEDLTAARLREALGLEPSADPVPDGVYLVRDDLGLGGIFVQGDLDEMLLAVDGATQVVAFRAAGAEWVLAFSPAARRTELRTPDGSFVFDLVPLPIVVVNGRIDSLGGGTVGADGAVAPSFDAATPAVLDGVDLTIVSSDRVTISSHLVLEGVRWQDGVPYAEGSEAQLVIYASGRDAVTGEALAGGIAVAEGAPADLKVQASLTAAVGGFAVEGTGKAVELLGALHAGEYDGNGNELAVFRDDRAAAGVFASNAPLSATPHLAVHALEVSAWKEY